MNKMYSMKTNSIYCGDCVEVLRYFPQESIDLIYIDPPFFSNKQYEILWGNGYELRAFEDRWKGGIRNYISWMEPKIRECYRVLKKTGSIYLHCDYHANAYLRILMDQIFGENNFQNEIIWCYKLGGRPRKGFPRKHDVIFFYSKHPEKFSFYTDAIRVPYESKGGYISSGRKIVKGKVYRVNPLGKVPEDWWFISPLNRQSKERLGYPTQKPEELLERIIKASSKAMDIVLDPMCGGGTTIAVAHRLGRRWIGIDVSPTACKLMVKRMRKLKARITEKHIIGLPKSVEELKTMPPFEFQNWVVQKLFARSTKKKVGDMGIDGWLLNGRPIQVKQSESIGRNVVDNFETAMRRRRKMKGMIIAFSFGKGAYEEVARAKQQEGLEIELKTIKELLKEV